MKNRGEICYQVTAHEEVNNTLLSKLNLLSETNTHPTTDHKYIAKIVLVGDRAVGKTSLRKRLQSESFTANYLATLGVDFSTKNIVVDDIVIELQIWDIAGQKNFATLAKRFMSKSDGALLVYDCTDEQTFENLETWIRDLQRMNKDDMPSFLIIGNKIDLQQPNRNPLQITEFFREKGLDFKIPLVIVNTSAKTGENVEVAFKKLAKKMFQEKDLEIK